MTNWAEANSCSSRVVALPLVGEMYCWLSLASSSGAAMGAARSGPPGDGARATSDRAKATRSSASIGFDSTSVAPSFIAAAASSSVAKPLMVTTGAPEPA